MIRTVWVNDGKQETIVTTVLPQTNSLMTVMTSKNATVIKTLVL